MAPQEKELTTILLGRLTKTEGQNDPEAEALIRQATAEILGASYYLVQTRRGRQVLLLVHGVLRGSVDARKGYGLLFGDSGPMRLRHVPTRSAQYRRERSQRRAEFAAPGNARSHAQSGPLERGEHDRGAAC